MLRRLSSRLTAAYVFAAIVLVIIVVTAVTGFALSMYGIGARESMRELARQVPEEVRMQVARTGSLEAAAPDIVRHLMRPGVRVGIWSTSRDGRDGREGRRMLAASAPDLGADGPPPVIVFSHGVRVANGGPGVPPAPMGGKFARGRPFPFGLGGWLGLVPTQIAVPGGTVGIMPDPEQLTRSINAFWLAMVPIGLFVIVASWWFGRTIAAQALRPLTETTASLSRFGDGDFTPRPVLTMQRDEIGELAEAYNRAAAQVSAAFEERRAVEMQMRQFVADAGHELRTPLTVIMGFIDVLRRRAAHDPGISTKIFDTMLAESRRMKALIDKLIVLARLENQPETAPATFDVADLAGRVVASMRGLEPRPPIALAAAPGVFVRADERDLHDALGSLVENAIKYAPGAPIDVSVVADGGHAAIHVDDRGPGIPEGERQLVFDRFYRGRDREPEAEGFGLGLAIAKRAVERAGGELSVTARLGGGARFTIRLPRSPRGEGAALAV